MYRVRGRERCCFRTDGREDERWGVAMDTSKKHQPPRRHRSSQQAYP